MAEDVLREQAHSGLGASEQVTYELDEEGRLTWQGPIDSLLGGGVDPPATLEAWLANVAQADRMRLRAALEARQIAPNRTYYQLERADGATVDVVESGASVSGGRRVGMVSDVTSLLTARVAAERARRQLRDTERIAGVGHFQLDLPDGPLACTDGVYRMLGEDPRGPTTLTLAVLETRLSPDDRDRFRQAIAACAAATTSMLELPLRVAVPGHGLRDLVVRGEVSRRRGDHASLVGTFLDVTEQRRAHDALRALVATQTRVAAALHLIFWSIDRDGNVTAASGQSVGGVDPSALVGLEVRRLPGATPAGLARAHRALSGEVVEETETVGDRVIRFHWFPERDEHGAITGANGFALDLTEHVQAEQARHAADDHLRLIAENMATVVWVATPALDRIFYLSPSFERVFGHPVATMIAEPSRWISLIHPDDRDQVMAAAQACPWQQDQRQRVVWPDGTVRWVEVHVRPVRDDQGVVIRAVGTAEDVTATQSTLDELQRAGAELQHSLDEKDTLLREIHHRVRNNLQVIQSLLNLQLRTVADPAVRRVLGDSQRRVQAMALVQDYLYDGRDLRRVALGAYLRRLLAALVSAQDDAIGRIALTTDVCDVNADTETAIHVGIAVTELVSNAFEHGFPEGRPGLIRVRGVIDAGRLQIDVEDDGVGFPAGFALAGVRSLGLTLVQTLVAHVRGEVRIEPCGGACFRIELPLDPR